MDWMAESERARRLTRISWSTILVPMKNVTITLDDEIARWARVYAAEHNTSVSRLLGSLLQERMERERAYDVARTRFISRTSVELRDPSEALPSRDSLHERG